MTRTVAAHCQVCYDEHPVGKRVAVQGTTRCPNCEGQPYNSQIVTDDTKLIRWDVKYVDGVGEQVMANVEDTFDTYDEFAEATLGDLTDIKHVGESTAEKIITERDDE